LGGGGGANAAAGLKNALGAKQNSKSVKKMHLMTGARGSTIGGDGRVIMKGGGAAGGNEETTQPNFSIVPPPLGSFAPLSHHISLSACPLHPSAADAAWQSLSLAAAAKANDLTCANKKTQEKL